MDRRVRSVGDLVCAVLAAREADDVALRQDLLTFGRAECRLAAKHDDPLLVRVVRVIRPELAAGLHLGHARADQCATDAVADERLLDTPAFAVSRFVPVVAVEIEDLHSADSRRCLEGRPVSEPRYVQASFPNAGPGETPESSPT